MARTRDIRPGFFKNEDLGECQPLARLLFAGLWCHADREGKLEDRPKRLKSEILPYDNCDCDELLNELACFGFLIRYEYQGKKYIKITGFEDNQRIHPKEQPSLIPDPEYIQSRGLPLQGDDLPLTCNAIPSSPSIPSLPTEIEPAKNGGSPKKGTRLSKDWFPPTELVEWAKKERPDLSIDKENERFQDYWQGVPGSKGVKLDWEATWRNWIRGTKNQYPQVVPRARGSNIPGNQILAGHERKGGSGKL